MDILLLGTIFLYIKAFIWICVGIYNVLRGGTFLGLGRRGWLFILLFLSPFLVIIISGL